MSERTWEWSLSTGETIRLTVDPASYIESVYVGGRLVSRSGNEGKPLGHTITLGAPDVSRSVDGGYRAATPQDLVVRLDAALMECELRANGQVVAPSRAPYMPAAGVKPGRVHRYVGAPPSMPVAPFDGGAGAWRIAKIVVLGVAGVAGFLLTANGARRYIERARAPKAPAGSLVASNGLVTVRFPAGFKATEDTHATSVPARREDDCKSRTCTVQVSVVKIDSVTRDEGAIVSSFKTNGLRIGTDVWRVSNLIHETFADSVKVHGSDYTETQRLDSTCFGETGAVVTGQFRAPNGEQGTLWSCTFIRDGNAFWVATFVNAQNAADEDAMRRIVDASELHASSP